MRSLLHPWQLLSVIVAGYLNTEQQRAIDYLIEEYLEHYHQVRPHQGIGNRTIEPRHPPPKEGNIVLKSRLGGVLKSYERRAV